MLFQKGGETIQNKLTKGTILQWQKKTKSENKRQEKKDKIQKAYRNAVNVEIIPAKKPKLSEDRLFLRVAAYCRVSTYEEAQAGSYELQIQHYKEMIREHPKWQSAGIYADEGLSATTMNRRVAFLQMLEDCKAGKIDLILTKSVSRLARNTRDCLEVVRQLKSLNPPVGIFFETENLNTLESNNEFTLGVMSLVAQGESELKSAAVTWSIIERFKKGIPIIPTHNLLGFDKTQDGTLVIVEEEANIVRYIYNNYQNGVSPKQIAQSLTDACIPTITGKPIWKSAGIIRILRNEKYCGDVIMQKTFTVDCFTHKKRTNTGQRPKYQLLGMIPAIVPKKLWLQVQSLLEKRRFTKKPTKIISKEPFVGRVKTGRLMGFVYIHPKWRPKEVNKVLSKLLKEGNDNNE